MPDLPRESSGQVGAALPMIWTRLVPLPAVTHMEPALSMETVFGLPRAPKIVPHVPPLIRQGITRYAVGVDPGVN